MPGYCSSLLLRERTGVRTEFGNSGRLGVTFALGCRSRAAPPPPFKQKPLFAVIATLLGREGGGRRTRLLRADVYVCIDVRTDDLSYYV